jgi:hypothetical protein
MCVSASMTLAINWLRSVAQRFACVVRHAVFSMSIFSQLRTINVPEDALQVYAGSTSPPWQTDQERGVICDISFPALFFHSAFTFAAASRLSNSSTAS